MMLLVLAQKKQKENIKKLFYTIAYFFIDQELGY